MEYSMYVCAKCKKVYKVKGNDKRVKCTNCENTFLYDMHIDEEQWKTFDKKTRDSKVNTFVEDEVIEEVFEEVLEEPIVSTVQKKEPDSMFTVMESKLDNPITKRETVFEGKIHKCPSCGAVLKSFVAFCPECGHEMRDAKASSAVSEFAKKLEAIESTRKTKSSGAAFAEAMGIKTNDKTDEQKINLIRSFAVPNTKEDVTEFLILAASNIDESLYTTNMQTTDKSVSNAWLAKTDQVYNKARIAFGNDPDFKKIEEIYHSKKQGIKTTKKEFWTRYWLILGLLIVMLVAGFAVMIIPASHSIKRANAADEELKQVVEEIQQDINNEDYDAAMIKANSLHYDESYSKTKAKAWDEQREALIELIKEKQGGK